jgi:hypothetical protein
MGQKISKKLSYSLNFSSILTTFFIFQNGAKNGKKIRLYIPLLFTPFFTFEKGRKNGNKQGYYLYFFSLLATFFTFEKRGKMEKSKPMALKFRRVLALS